MYHNVGCLGVFILALCHKSFLGLFLLLVLLFIIIVNIEKVAIIAAVAIAIALIVYYHKRGPQKIREAANHFPLCDDEIFLHLKFGMDIDEVKETISKLENKSAIRKEGNRLFCTFVNGEEAEIYLYYKASELWRMKIILSNIPIKRLRKMIHQEMTTKGYAYYRSLFFNKRCYIKQNIVMSMYYLPSGIDKWRSSSYQTWIDYMDSTKLAQKLKDPPMPALPTINSADF